MSKAFNQILAEIEASDPPALRAGQRYARALHQFEAMSAVVSEAPTSEKSVHADRPSWWETLIADAMEQTPEQPETLQDKARRQPLTLAQLKKKLRHATSHQELHRLRRRFALDHHPDLAPQFRRDVSARELSIVNDLIDQALRDADRKRANE